MCCRRKLLKLMDVEPQEIEAVLAHELGHFRLKHIQKRLLSSTAMSFCALALLGYPARPKVTVTDLMTTPVVNVGEAFEWRCTVTSGRRQNLIVALRLHYLKANGGQSAKVFRVKDVALGKGEQLEIVKRQPFKPITTRTLYPGTHAAELVVNGTVQARCEFELVAD